MRALTSYDYRAIAKNLGGRAWRQARDGALHACRQKPVRWLRLALYLLFSGLLLVLVVSAVAVERVARALLPRGYERLDDQLESYLEDTLK